MSVVLRYIAVCHHVGPDTTAQPISVESNYVFWKLQIQDLDFTPVNSPSATDTKGGAACESLQSLEIHITELDWIMLLRSVVTERNLTECESNCLGWRDAVQFDRQVYVTAPSWCISSKITRRHMLEDSNFHIQCITVYYVHKPLNISECASKITSFGRLNVSTTSEGYCKLLLTCRIMMCVSAAACSGLVQVMSVDLVSHFHTARYKLTT
jgi:hypothetical protein